MVNVAISLFTQGLTKVHPLLPYRRARMQRHKEKLFRTQQHVHPVEEAEVLRKRQNNLSFTQELN